MSFQCCFTAYKFSGNSNINSQSKNTGSDTKIWLYFHQIKYCIWLKFHVILQFEGYFRLLWESNTQHINQHTKTNPLILILTNFKPTFAIINPSKLNTFLNKLEAVVIRTVLCFTNWCQLTNVIAAAKTKISTFNHFNLKKKRLCRINIKDNRKSHML